MKREAGFTLIELMVVVVIAALLTAIGVPSYRAYLLHARRQDGRDLLERAAADEQRFFTLYSTYTVTVVGSGGCKGQACGLGYAGDTSQGRYYTLSITPVAGGIGSGFVVAAAPTAKGGQNGDSRCGALTLSSTGARGFTGTGKLAECWP